jgi:hypothetical protein
MPRRNAIDVIAPAWQHMKDLLFPIRWSIWWRVAVIGFLTGEMHSGGGSNFSVPQFPQQHQHKLLADVAPYMVALIALAVVAGLVLVVVLMYVGSVFRFILFESVLTRRIAIGEGWRKWQRQGMRFFAFNLFLMLGAMAVIAVFAIPIILAIVRNKGHMPAGAHLALLIAGGIFAVMFFVLLILALTLVYTLVKDFVVPQMALEDLSLGDAWRRLWAQMMTEKGSYAGYVGMKIVLSLGAALAFGIAFFVIIIVLAIPAVIVGVVVAKVAHGAPLIIALAIALAIPLIVVLIGFFALLSSPVTIFFPAYSMHFYADRYPPLAALLYPQPPPPPAPEPPPIPPIEPAPAPA